MKLLVKHSDVADFLKESAEAEGEIVEVNSLIPTDSQIESVNDFIIESGGFRNGLTPEDITSGLSGKVTGVGDEMDKFNGGKFGAYLAPVPDFMSIKSVELNEEGVKLSLRVNDDNDSSY